MTHVQQKQKVFSFKISFYSENTAHDKNAENLPGSKTVMQTITPNVTSFTKS